MSSRKGGCESFCPEVTLSALLSHQGDPTTGRGRKCRKVCVLGAFRTWPRAHHTSEGDSWRASGGGRFLFSSQGPHAGHLGCRLSPCSSAARWAHVGPEGSLGPHQTVTQTTQRLTWGPSVPQTVRRVAVQGDVRRRKRTLTWWGEDPALLSAPRTYPGILALLVLFPRRLRPP